MRKQKTLQFSHTDHQVFERELLSASLSDVFSKSAMVWLENSNMGLGLRDNQVDVVKK